MTDRQTVTEVIATAALEVDVPLDDGDDLAAGIETVLGDLDTVRHVAVEELGDVTPGDGHLRVDVYTRLTLHFDPDIFDDAGRATRDRLAAADAIATVRTVDIESGPYRIEAW